MREALAVLGLAAMTACGSPTTYKVSWSFANLQEGYDHDNRVDVWLDGAKVAESTVTAESVPNSVQFDVPPGAHTLRVVNLAHYDGKWEEHTVGNEYSIDCLWEGPVDGKGKLELVFDIDQGTLVRKHVP